MTLTAIFQPGVFDAKLSFTPLSIAAGAPAGTLAGTVSSKLPNAAFSVLGGNVSIGPSLSDGVTTTASLLTTAVAPYSGALTAEVQATDGAGINGSFSTIAIPITAQLAPITPLAGSYFNDSPAGTRIATFDTTETGAAYSISPNDGRVVISADGLGLEVGTTASSAGTAAYALTKSEAGYATVAANFVVTVVPDSPTYVQSAYQQFSATTAPSVTLAKTPVVGNVLVLITMGDKGASHATPTGATSISFYGGTGNGVQVWTLPVAAGQGKTITWPDSAVTASWGAAYVAEVANWNGATPQVATGAMGGSGTAWTFTEPTPLDNYGLQLAAVVNYQGSQQTINSGASVLQNAYGNSGGFGCSKLFTLPAGTKGTVTATTQYSANSCFYAAVTLRKAAVPVLTTLDLSNKAPVQGALWTANILGGAGGSTYAATSSDGTALTVAGSQVSGTFTGTGSPTITLTETNAGATGSPKTSTVGVAITLNINLASLALVNTTPAAGNPWTSAVSGLTNGSTFSATASDGTVLTCDQVARTVSGTFSGAGSPTVTLVEAYAGANNTPNTTPVGVTVGTPSTYALTVTHS